MDEHPSTFNMLALPTDALNAVSRQLVCDSEHCLNCCACVLLTERAVKHLAATCSAVSTAVLGDEALWASMLEQRHKHHQVSRDCLRGGDCSRLEHELGALEISPPGGSSRSRYRIESRAARGKLEQLPLLTPAPESLCCSSGVVSAGAPLAMSANPTSGGAVELLQLAAVVEQLLARMSCLDASERITVADAVAWLLEPHAAPATPRADALTQLAVVWAVRRSLRQPPEPWRQDSAMRAPSTLAHQLQQLGPLPARLSSCRLEVKIYTWSQLRDCRGFRARNDVTVRRATLCELLTHEHADEVWRVLDRGTIHEVQRITIREETG